MRINAGVTEARVAGIVRPHDTVIIVTGSIAGPGNTNAMQIFQVRLYELTYLFYTPC